MIVDLGVDVMVSGIRRRISRAMHTGFGRLGELQVQRRCAFLNLSMVSLRFVGYVGKGSTLLSIIQDTLVLLL